MEKLIEIIGKQQEGHENTAVFMVGEQLKDIAASDPKCLEILKQDLEVEGMGIVEAEKEIKKYADKHKGKGKVPCFCVSPMIADEILRKFYGLPAREDANSQTLGNTPSEPAKVEVKKPSLSLLDFM